MRVKGLAWPGIRTQRFEDTTRFFAETLGLRVEHAEPGFMVFKPPNGDTVEVLGLETGITYISRSVRCTVLRKVAHGHTSQVRTATSTSSPAVARRASHW